jgi:hypothetical protein
MARWKGPDVLVVGWIPFHTDPPQVSGFPAGIATTALFHSGNPPPPEAFDDYAGFASWLYPKNPNGTKEYRAAIYLEGVVAEFPDDDSPPQADRTANGCFIGFTPSRLFIGGTNILAALPRFPSFMQGIGPPPGLTLSRDRAGRWVELCYRAEFKLCWLASLISKMLTQYWPPHAWCEIRYRFSKSGRIDILVKASAIPSLRLYIDWNRPVNDPPAGIRPEYDMLAAKPAEVAGFIKTSGWGCRPAPPGGVQLVWQGDASPA